MTRRCSPKTKQAMGPFDGLIASSNTRHRIKLFTSLGLEKLLVHELSTISKECTILTGGRCFVDAQVDLYSLWKVMLRTRICDQLWIHVCEPLEARHTRTFVRSLNNAEWREFIPFSANMPLPYVKVNTNDSSLYHTGMIKKLVHQVIKGHCHKSLHLQGDELPAILKRRGHLPVCPSLMVNIDNDECEVLANASGDLSERPWHKESTLDPRIRSSMTAAIVQNLDIVQKIRDNSITTIWDPFCHIGTLLFELYSILNGIGVRSLDHAYPLDNFPLNCKQTAEDAASSLLNEQDLPHINVKLLGTDVFQNHVTEAKAIYSKYLLSLDKITPTTARVKHPTEEALSGKDDSDTESKNNSPSTVTLTFSEKTLEDLQVDPSSTLILTNLYYGDKDQRKNFLAAHRIFEELLLESPPELLQNVYVVATENFKKHSHFIWRPLLQFTNNGIRVTLMKLNELKNGLQRKINNS